MTNPDTSPAAGRRLSYAGFAAVAAVYLAIIQGGGRLAQEVFDAGDGFTTTRDVIVNMWIPLGAALIFTYGVIAYLGWLKPVLSDDRPTQRWVWAVPIILAICLLGAIDYADLGDKGLGFALALFVATQFVGWGEEGMFRGIGVTVFREHGLTEGKVALWSSIAFGAVHLTNALSSGGQAVQQAIVVSFAGYFFYLTRRASGGNVLNSVLHGLFDFSLLTGTAIIVDQKGYAGSGFAILAYLLIALLVLARRKHIEPAATGSA
ncbi:CPBP family intramembrane metalloprotease [Nocardioides marmoriginsengisoli]|uniref:CPBP family intramembrane metalloprotease n=1 Tax=Nocardioides marmoriginsengisoli TaxID=661483 RepID=A0A3N0CDI4_9ACTN|nr:CPBP family intramembrane glutamic endopeptidase [Nocardioides marmoriginsengisoli]RNL61063.1 CPBP family intramembrane metalloprotease [Nocardioides marmoriginsengisoli]